MSFKYISKLNNSLRHARLIDRSLLWKKNALKKLTVFFYNRAGRSNTGIIVARFRGNRARKRARILSQSNSFLCIPGYICRIEYDPNRSAFISLVLYSNNVCAYFLHTSGLSIGDRIVSYLDLSIPGLDNLAITFNNGDSSYLFCVPSGSLVHDLESIPLSGGVYSRSAGSYCIILKKFFRLRSSFIQLPSTQLRSFSFFCFCTKGIVSNDLHYRISLGKAGRNRLLGYNPIVRGVAKNPVDHAHGGGEGKKSKPCFPRTAWGKMLHWRKTGVRFVNVHR